MMLSTTFFNKYVVIFVFAALVLYACAPASYHENSEISKKPLAGKEIQAAQEDKKKLTTPKPFPEKDIQVMVPPAKPLIDKAPLVKQDRYEEEKSGKRTVVEGRMVDKDILIAVFPVDNLSGQPAPLNDIRQSLLDSLEQKGLNILDKEVLESFMARHRMRYTGGIDSSIAKALKDEIGVSAALLTSLELFNDVSPPKIAFTTRLVATDDNMPVLWMKGAGLAGDDAPRLLNLGLIEDKKLLVEKAVELISASLKDFVSGRRRSYEISFKGTTFWPNVIYRSPVIDRKIKYRLAVLPFYNISERKNAGDIMALHFINKMRTLENIDVIEPGTIRQLSLNYRIIMDDGVSMANAGIVFSKVDADLILTGKVMDYHDYQGGGGTAKVDFSTMLIDRKSNEVVWSSKSYNSGDDGVFFFDLGRTNTAHAMASEMAEHVVRMMFK
jgi:hypothetical protein